MSECYPTGCNPILKLLASPKHLKMVSVIVCPLVQWVKRNAGCMTSASLAGAPKVLVHHLLAIVVLYQLKLKYLDLKTPSNQIEAGDWYIQNADATGPYAVGWGTSIGSSVEVGDRNCL